MKNDFNDLYGEVVFTYSRAEAICDGVLVDITNQSKPMFKIPVAMTAAALYSVRDNIRAALIDLYNQITKTNSDNTDLIFYTTKIEHQKLKAMIHGGDQGEAVITIMLPHED